ncbi:MAG: UvrD-helicase domain-containing protein [Phycisphaera sp.]|nr:UvrD-helicase domain-containing protein [Phycisphaera sp.]
MSRDDVFTNRRIMASAGTGKTWNLAARYLDLVLAGVDPSTILATTFTRAAAAEIRDRVLTDAARLVVDPGMRADASDTDRFASGPVDAAAAARLLHVLVASLPGLQIRTLDSLFVSLASGLGPSSGVPTAVRMADEETSAELLREAIGVSLDAADEDEILSTLETLGQGKTKVAVVGAVERAIADLLAVARESSADAWSWPTPPPDPDAIASIIGEFAAVLPSLPKRETSAIEKIMGLLESLRERDGGPWTEVFGSALVKASGPDGDGLYYKKPILESIAGPLARVHPLAAEGNLRNLSRRTECLRSLIDLVDPSLSLLKRRARLASFDDFVRALDPLRGSGPPERLAELWFRLDVAIEHLLLDEFQDTSATQLRAIRPVAEEILSGGDGERPRSMLVVGDVKQSIYGWRGGDPAILERLDEVLGEGMVEFEERELATSYRSSPAVIDFVNTVFDGIASNPAVLAESPEAAAHFGRLFRPHGTARDHAGEACVEFLPDPDDDDDKVAVIAEQAAEAAARLVERHGLADEDGDPSVAVLVRTNRPIGPIVEALRARGVPASGRGSGSLLDAEASVAVVQAFRLAADPEDRLAAEDLARSPLGPMVGLPASEGHAALGDEVRRAAALGLRAMFSLRGPARVVDRWRRELAARLTDRESARLRQMVEQLSLVDADPEGPRSARRLARHLETCRVDDPGGDGVLVMTIHQSKGLEFAGVVVTDMGSSLLHRPTLAVETPAVPASGIERVSTWYSEKSRPEVAVPVHRDTIDRDVLESLCGLYVAITRAAADVVVQVERPKFTKGGEPAKTSLSSWGGVVRNAIDRDTDEDAADPQDPAFESETIWRTGAPKGTSSEGDLEPAKPSVEPPSWSIRTTGRRRRAVIAPPPSAGHDRFRVTRGPDPALERGRVVHAGLEMIERAADLDRLGDDDFARELASRCPVDPAILDDPDEIGAWYLDRCAAIRTLLADPGLRDVFDGARGEAGGTPEVKTIIRRELPLVIRGDDGVRIGVVDRLVLHLAATEEATAGPTVIGASIIDFKTDRPGDGSGADHEAFAGRHRDQVRVYASAIGDRYGLDPSRIRVSLIRVDDGAIVDIAAG